MAQSHRRDKIDLSGTNARVLYRDGWKSASAQSAAQVYSVKQFISHQLSWSPYVCNLLLFPNLRKADLPSTPNTSWPQTRHFKISSQRINFPPEESPNPLHRIPALIFVALRRPRGIELSPCVAWLLCPPSSSQSLVPLPLHRPVTRFGAYPAS